MVRWQRQLGSWLEILGLDAAGRAVIQIALEAQQPNETMTLQSITHGQHHDPVPMRLTATRHSSTANFGPCGVVIQRLCAALPSNWV